MSCTDTDDSNMPTCANCGKRSDDLKACTSCDLLKYCSEACQELHKPKHRGECNKRTSELDEALFKLPPKLEEDCPICFLRMPLLDSGKRYHECCGKTICSGCFYASAMMDGNVDELCPFCRSPNVTTTSDMEEMNKRAELGDAEATSMLGCYYMRGEFGLPQDMDKALELWHRAAELDHVEWWHVI